MSKTKTAWKTILTHISIIILTGLTARILLDVLFFALYGPHAVNQIELWLYYGVAQGTHLTGRGPGDPTVVLLGLLGGLLTGDPLFYSISALAAALTVLAAVLIYLLVREFSDEKTAYLSAIIYSFLPETLDLSIVGFTHDLLVMPLMLAAVLSAVWAWKAKRMRNRIICTAALVVLIYLGALISLVMYVTLGIITAYIFSKLVIRWPKHETKLSLLYFAGMILFGACVIPIFMDYTLQGLPQGRFGSGDVVPVSIGNFWVRYNILYALIPFGIYVAYKRREHISLSYLILGFSFALVMDRGTRLMDVGVAMLAGYALTEWTPKWKKHIVLITAAFLILSYVLAVAPATYLLMVSVGGILMAWALSRKKINLTHMLAILITLNLALTVAGLTLNTHKFTTETEYRLYGYVLKNQPPGKVLTSWERGYMAEVLSGKTSASTAAEINYEADDALWLTQKQANAILNRNGIDYLVISDRHYNNVNITGDENYLLEGGLLFPTAPQPPISLSNHLTAYGLRYGEADKRYFISIAEYPDKTTGEVHHLYQIIKQKTNASYITLIASNLGNETINATVEVAVNLGKPQENRRKSILSLLDPILCVTCAIKTSIALGAAAAMLVLARLATNPKAKKGRGRIIPLIAVILASAVLLYYIANPQEAVQTGEPTPTDTIHKNYNIVFQPGLSYEIPLDADPHWEIINCTAEITNPEPSWGYSGETTFMNTCYTGYEDVTILLVDLTTSNATTYNTEDTRTAQLNIRKGQEKTVEYSFNRRNPTHQYTIAYYKRECVKVTPDKTTKPTTKQIETHYTYCEKTTERKNNE